MAISPFCMASFSLGKSHVMQLMKTVRFVCLRISGICYRMYGLKQGTDRIYRIFHLLQTCSSCLLYTSLSQWVGLARVYDTNPLKDVAQRGDELFDIVDELNQVTGQGTRREIHEGSLRHRAVHMFLVNKLSLIHIFRRIQKTGE